MKGETKMKKVLSVFKAYLTEEDGQTSMEYILILALAAAIIFKLRGKFNAGMDSVTTKVFDKIDGFANGIDDF